MGKKEKAPTIPAGRVPLVQDGKPLLYSRYNSIDELLQVRSGVKAENVGEDGVNGAGAGERPNKKQKRAAAATPASDAAADSEQPTSAPSGKGYGVVGEDGLTYKQRRQLRRAAERAAKAQADAAAGGVTTAVEPAAAVAGAGAAPQAPSDAAPQADAMESGDAKVKKDKKDRKKDKRSRDGQETAAAGTDAAAAAAAATAAKGNADEAARMRALLGFSSAASGGRQGGALSLAALVTPANNPMGGNNAAGGNPAPAAPEMGVDAGPPETSEKKRKKDKKGKSQGPHGGEAASAGQEEGEAEQPLEGQGTGKGDAGNSAAAALAVSAADKPAAQPAKPAARAGNKKGVAKSAPPFSFEFQLQDEVEAETEARLARLMALDSTKDGFVPRRVWVSGLPHEYDEDTVREYWSYCGEVESMHLLTFPDSGNFNGTAFITFKTQEGYEAALACNGEMLEGRALRVEKCKAAAELKGKARFTGMGAAANGTDGGKAPAAAAGDGKGGRVEGYPVAYCGNISFEAGVDELQQLFVAAGVTPTKVRLHTDKASGRSKGYAHVHFGSGEDVDKAVALDGTSFHGRKIRVSYAQPKPGETA